MLYFLSKIIERSFRYVSLLSITFFLLNVDQDAEAKKHALVIGNNSYEYIDPLKRAVNDSIEIARSLNSIGYEVQRYEDLSESDFSEAVGDFVLGLKENDEVFFFFSGHGVSVGASNFMLPTDIPDLEPKHEPTMDRKAISIHYVLSKIRSRNTRVNIIVVDACRENPFSGPDGKSVGNSKGLAATIAPRGTLIMYSAGAGELAYESYGGSDGHPNSLFVRSLLPYIAPSNLTMPEIARKVRVKTNALARKIGLGYRQWPAYYDELRGDYHIAKALKAPTVQDNDPLDTKVPKVDTYTSKKPALSPNLRRIPTDLPEAEAGEDIESEKRSPLELSKDEIRKVQKALENIIRPRLNIDGINGDQTKKAVKRYLGYRKLTNLAWPDDYKSIVADIERNKSAIKELYAPSSAKKKVLSTSKQPSKKQNKDRSIVCVNPIFGNVDGC